MIDLGRRKLLRRIARAPVGCLWTYSAVLGAAAGFAREAPVFNVLDYGARGDGAADCTRAIQSAIDAAGKAGGGTVVIPPGTYVYTDVLLVPSHVTVIGTEGAVLHAKAERQAVTLKGENIVLRHLHLRSEGTRRRAANVYHAIAGESAINVQIEHCRIEGASAAGIYMKGCRNFRIRHNVVVRTLADTIHITGGSAHGVVSGNRCLRGGDDGVGVVSYAPQRARCHDILIDDNVIVGGDARGVAVLGGERIYILRNRIQETKWAGIYIASEDSFDTFASGEIWVEDNDLAAVNRRSDEGTHACITILGRPGSSLAESGEIENKNRKIHLIANRIRGDGRGGIRIDPFNIDVTVASNEVLETLGWGISTSAFGARVVGNRIAGAADGGIIVPLGCFGGETDLVANAIDLTGGGRRLAIVVDAPRLSRLAISGNRIRYDRRPAEEIRVTRLPHVSRSYNTVNGVAID
ncbi:MAG TPA: glycosyl hydrolase family 28-related protein [Alphaproteobacteria bacterium]